MGKNIKLRENNNGGWVKASKGLLNDNSISSDAKILYLQMMNTPPTVNSSLIYYYDKLGWSQRTGNRKMKELTEAGYVHIKKYSNGKTFFYNYTLSDYANLNITKKPDESSTSSNNDGIDKNSYQEDVRELNVYIASIPEPLLNEIEEDMIETMSCYIGNPKGALEGVKTLVSSKCKEAYQFALTNTNKFDETTQKVKKDYKDWLKAEIFDNMDLTIQFNKKFDYMRLQNSINKNANKIKND